MISLRPYQESGVSSIRAAFRENMRAPLAVAPTGAGKTVLFSFIAEGASKRRNRVMIVAHRKELLRQISATLSKFGVHHGMICPGYTPNQQALVQVASVQALARRLKKRDYPVDLLVIDEAHHALPGNTWGKVYAALGKPPILGVTASPARSDGTGLGVTAGGIFDHMIEIVSVAELINDAYLVQPIVYAPPVVVDLTGLRTKYGDFERDALADRMDSPKVTGDAVDHYRRLCSGTTAVAFGVSIQHCEHIAADFRSAGFNFQVIDGSMEDKRRDALIDGLGKEIQGLVSCDLIGEGVDIPAIGCAIMLRPTQSTVLHVQQMGRALRPIYADGFDLSSVDGRRGALRAAGKEHAIILDHVGNSLRHGLPETPREWSLDGVKKKKKKADEDSFRILQCRVCYAAFAPAAVCPQCGAPVRTESRQIEVVDGELKRITAEDIAAMKEQKRIEVAQAKTIDDLKRIERERNYTPGWAEHIYAAKKKKIEAHRRRREANARTELFG